MVSSIRTVHIIICLALFSIQCTAYRLMEDEEFESASQEQQYSARELLNLLFGKRVGPADACKKCTKACLGAIGELGQSGMVVDVIGKISNNAQKKAQFCSLYERAYPPHLNGKLDHDEYDKIIKEAAKKNSMSAGEKAKCLVKDVVKNLKGDTVNTCLAIADKVFSG